jgi:hypothetical protein
MPTKHEAETNPEKPLIYQIRLEGQLGPQWAGWFAGFTVKAQENGETLLTGPVADQADLFGVLKKVRDIGMPLLSVVCFEDDQVTAVDNK